MNKQLSTSLAEFVTILALLTALGALATDTMLPALTQMGKDFGVTNANDVQFIVYSIFGGFAIGQIFYGPLSDFIGRKKTIYISLSIFIIGSFVSLLTDDFYTMLFGRFLQGFGASGAKVIPMALIRDIVKGREMAKIMSFIALVFIIVPAIAPIIGGFILKFESWHYIFVMFIVSAIISFVWFGLRVEETLSKDKMIPFSLKNLKKDISLVIKNKKTLLYTVVLGLVFGAFMSYLSTAEQIFALHYNLGEDFPYYFALNALSLGLASLANAKFVEKLGMRYLSKKALEFLLIICVIFTCIVFTSTSGISLFSFMVFCISSFFCIGILFGNLNALAMEPMGKVAGTAASIIGAVSMLIALIVGVLIGQFYDNSVTPMIVGFSIVSVVSYVLFLVAKE